MIVIGAKGFAKEVLEIIHQSNELDNLVFYDDLNDDINGKLFNKFPILKTTIAVVNYFKTTDNKFTIGVGNPILRKKLYDKFTRLGGEFTSVINQSYIGSYDVSIGVGANILSGVTISNGVKIGIGVILYYNTIITHDCVIGDFVEISPGVTILGKCKVGNYCQIGANTTILPNIRIGDNVIIGAGAVITKSLPDNCVALGVPAKILKELKPLNFDY
jgi:sugar O-acyltransferase (sialic acid O-acetyltransferase NeuD family)